MRLSFMGYKGTYMYVIVGAIEYIVSLQSSGPAQL